MQLQSLALACAVVFLAQLVRGAVGFGSALITVPLLTLVVGPVQAMLINAVLDALGGAWLLRGPRPRIAPRLMLALVLPMVAGLGVGLAVAGSLSPVLLATAIGAFVTVYGCLLLVRPVGGLAGAHTDLPVSGLAAVLARAGAAAGISGVLLGLIGIPGPLVVVALRSTFDDAFFRVQTLAFFLIGALCLALALTLGGHASIDTGRYLLVLLLPMALGTATGRRLGTHLSHESFGRVVGLILGGAGAALVYASVLS